MSAPTIERGFAEALKIGDRGRLVAFPKADRHCHSILGASLGSIISWAGTPIAPAPSRMEGLPGMSAYARLALYPHIRTRLGFEFTAETAIREAIADGVTIFEMSLDADLIPLYESGVAGAIAFAKALVERYSRDIDFRPEIGLSRRADPSPQIALADECVESGVFRSIDLYGLERAQEPEAYRELFKKCRRLGLKLKAHVGEFGDAELVERTWRVLELDEVQHGIAAASSVRLMEMLREADVRLNVCPSSNVSLLVARDIGSHPIKTLVRNGLRVTVNTDDKTVFGRTVTEEYLELYRAGTLEADEVEGLRTESLRG
jgi:adenosine deaminase